MEILLSTKAFADTIKKLRIKKGLTQPELAELMSVSRSAVSMWELGARLPDVEMIDRLSACLEVDIQYLLDSILGKTDTGVTILVVEDIPALLDGSVAMIKEVIPKAEVVGFRNGPETLSYCKKNNADVAFLDIGLDEYMNGLELSLKLKDQNPYIDIIFLTNYTKYLEKAIYYHCSGYIVKPLTRRRIRHELSNLRCAKNRLESLITWEKTDHHSSS